MLRAVRYRIEVGSSIAAAAYSKGAAVGFATFATVIETTLLYREAKPWHETDVSAELQQHESNVVLISNSFLQMKHLEPFLHILECQPIGTLILVAGIAEEASPAITPNAKPASTGHNPATVAY